MKELIYTKTFENNKELKNIFIPTANNWKSTEEQNLSVIESGEKGILFDKIIEKINNTQEMICLQSFLIQDTKIIDALVKAKNRGVKVYILDSAEARLNSGFEEDESFATKDYIQMIRTKFKNNFIHRQAHNLHAKYILLDPRTNPSGYIFTGNFNQKPFFENPELAVPLTKIQIKELFKIFVYHFWEHTTDEQTASYQFDKVSPSGKFKLNPVSNILLTSPNAEFSNLKETLIEAVNTAEKEIIISTFSLEINHKLPKKILEKLKSGVKVTVFCRPREKAIVSNIEVLSKNGAKVICHPLIHAKILLIDNKTGFVFTANFENHGLDKGFEVGLKLNAKQTNDLIKIIDNWKKTFPFTYKHAQALIETDKYAELDSIKKIKEVLPEKTEQRKIQINNTGNIIQAIKNINKPSNSLAKKYKVELKLIFNEINPSYKTLKKLVQGVELIEYEKKKNQKNQKMTNEQAILIDTKLMVLNDDSIEILNQHKKLKVFAK